MHSCQNLSHEQTETQIHPTRSCVYSFDVARVCWNGISAGAVSSNNSETHSIANRKFAGTNLPHRPQITQLQELSTAVRLDLH